MIGERNLIVRFREGSGGETLTAMLHALLNDDAAALHYDPRFNQTVFTDCFCDGFHAQRPSPLLQARFDLPDAPWSTRPPADLAAFVANRLDDCPHPYRIGKMHYVLTPAQTRALPPASVIDLLPSRAHAFVPAAMVLLKVYLRPAYEVPDALAHPQYEAVLDHLRDKGSIPFHWTRCLRLGLDIHDLHGFVRHVVRRSLVMEDTARYPRSSHVVPATSFLLDPGLAAFRDLAIPYGHVLPDGLAAYLGRWVARNNAMFDALGLRRLLGLSLTLEQQATLLAEALREHQLSLTS